MLREEAVDFVGCRVGAMVWVGVKEVSWLSYIRYLILREGVVGSLVIMQAFTDGLGRWLGLFFYEALHALSIASLLLFWDSR